MRRGDPQGPGVTGHRPSVSVERTGACMGTGAHQKRTASFAPKVLGAPGSPLFTPGTISE
jgi:hypothetical protein